MQAERRVGRSGLGARWMVANVVGYTVAGAVVGAVQRARMQPYFEVVMSAADAARIEP
jgi:hypothetical protein